MKNILISFGLIAMLAAGCSSSSATNPKSSAPTNTSTSKASTSPTPTGVVQREIPMSEVAAANNAQKCWSVINNKVYDLTKFITKHPGGSQRILSICGKDGTSAFGGQHSGQPRPEKELAGLAIGTLKK
jgi:cytochrome b involved in lipid metabolism